MTERIRIGISSCLIGERVRYNGDHKRDRYVADVLSAYFEYLPCCPEVAIGLGVPRATIQLRAADDGPRAVQPKENHRDVTDALSAYGRHIGEQERSISGYILKARSPSCGMARVKVYDRNGSPSGAAPGIFAAALKAEQPLLPMEEEGRLSDRDLRDNFIERVFVWHRWRMMAAAGITASALVRFHCEHEFLVPAHSRRALWDLGGMTANLKTGVDGIAAAYIERLMKSLARPAKRDHQANALQHIAGCFKDVLDGQDRRELADAIDGYRRGEPVIVPLTLIRHHLRRHPDACLENERYLEARPRAVDTTRR